MQEADTIRARHMLDAAREAVSFARDRTRFDLDTDRMLVLSLVKSIEIIGEAAHRIPAEARCELQGIPWPDIIGMRHRLIHAYFDANLDILWQKTIQDDLPPLVTALESLLSSEGT